MAGTFLVLGLEGSASQPYSEGFVGAFALQSDHDLFGGLSSIEMSEDGMSFLAITDRGAWLRGTFTRGPQDQITDAMLTEPRLLRGRFEAPLEAGRNDSEGLAVAPDGSVYISFENVARVLRYPTIDGPAQNLITPREFASLQRNSALEALAVSAGGTLYTIPERSGQLTRPFPVWRYRDGKWDQPFGLRRDGGYLVVGADFGPDGRLYVLEREFHGIAGFSSRLRSFSVGEDSLTDERTELESGTGQHDNLEGVAIWRDAGGSLRATMISDDNFNFFQTTEIVEYRLLPDAGVPSAND